MLPVTCDRHDLAERQDDGQPPLPGGLQVAEEMGLKPTLTATANIAIV